MQASSLKEQMLQPMLTSLVDLVVGQRFTDGAQGKPAAPPVRTAGQRVGHERMDEEVAPVSLVEDDGGLTLSGLPPEGSKAVR